MTLFAFIVTSVKFQLKLINTKILLPVNFRNEISITLIGLIILQKDLNIIILSCLTSLDSSKPIQRRISVNHEGISTHIVKDLNAKI